MQQEATGQNGTVLNKYLVTYVNETGLYRLTFQAHTDLAEQFKKWVLSDVLPSIRRTGVYKTPELKAHAANSTSQRNRPSLPSSTYIRRFHSNLILIVPSRGGEYQDTSAKRCDTYKEGFTDEGMRRHNRG